MAYFFKGALLPLIRFSSFSTLVWKASFSLVLDLFIALHSAGKSSDTPSDDGALRVRAFRIRESSVLLQRARCVYASVSCGTILAPYLSDVNCCIMASDVLDHMLT